MQLCKRFSLKFSSKTDSHSSRAWSNVFNVWSHSQHYDTYTNSPINIQKKLDGDYCKKFIKFHCSAKEITANQFREEKHNTFLKGQWKGDLGAIFFFFFFFWDFGARGIINCSNHLQNAQWSCSTGTLQVLVNKNKNMTKMKYENTFPPLILFTSLYVYWN